MRDTQALVKEFHEAFGLAIDQPVTRDTFELRASLLEEEMTEVREAVEEFNGLLYRPAYDRLIVTGISVSYMGIICPSSVRTGSRSGDLTVRSLSLRDLKRLLEKI